jgi:hypothetical protein
MKSGAHDVTYHYFMTYRINTIEVEKDPNKEEEQVHVFLLQIMEW